jgi:regulator of sigma E protease
MFYTVINLFTGKVPLNSLSGPVGIYEIVDETRKDENALANIINLTAILSVNLGLMNILPIPALDGGHVLFLLIELITRKKVNEKLEGITTTVFFFLLMLLMLYITIKDVIVMILR